MDIRLIRDNPDEARQMLALRRSSADLDRILELDERRREAVRRRDAARTDLKRCSEQVARAKREGRDATALMEEARRFSDAARQAEAELAAIEAEQERLVRALPNSVAAGVTDTEEIVAEWGEKPVFDFPVLAHWDLCPALGVVDFEAAARLAGSRFVLFRGAGALLERALINYFLDVAVRRHGYTEISPPVLANAATLEGSGQLPHLEADMYALKDEGLYLIPTAEPALVGYHRGEVLNESDLPLKYVAWTCCFRREAGSYGKDVRGMIRVHQFDKVELVRLTLPERSDEDLEQMRQEAEFLLRELGLAYRVKRLAAWDMAFQSAKTYDLEVWAAAEERWLEVSSISNCLDYQTRRLKIRGRRRDGRSFIPHSLNGSALALPRVFIAIMENYQQADGSVRVPGVLKSYMHGLERIG
ncbi:MAG: serine--tRNA ligase [candidate division WOR-3 bacterium]